MTLVQMELVQLTVVQLGLVLMGVDTGPTGSFAWKGKRTKIVKASHLWFFGNPSLNVMKINKKGILQLFAQRNALLSVFAEC